MMQFISMIMRYPVSFAFLILGVLTVFSIYPIVLPMLDVTKSAVVWFVLSGVAFRYFRR